MRAEVTRTTEGFEIRLRWEGARLLDAKRDVLAIAREMALLTGRRIFATDPLPIPAVQTLAAGARQSPGWRAVVRVLDDSHFTGCAIGDALMRSAA